MIGADPSAVDPEPPVAIYLHIPFCLSICPWCDFVVYGGSAARGPKALVPAFLRALHVELDLRADAVAARWPRRPKLATVYVGGGTPSLLSPGDVADLLDHVERRFALAADAEITLELNPGPDDRGDVRGFVSAGVTRLSLGVQSLDQCELRTLGRRHRPEDAGAAVAEARRAGARSVSLDLLYDIPGSSLATWAATLEGALALAPDHLSLYALMIGDPEAEGLTGPDGDHLPVRPAARRWRSAARQRQDEDRAVAQYEIAVQRLARDGWRGYEISSWARPGHESRHNQVYWARRPYEAVGPGAHAFDGQTRRWNSPHLQGYLGALLPGDGRHGTLPPGGSERLDARTAAAEAAILALRTDHGLSRVEASLSPLAEHVTWAIGNGLLAWLPPDRLALTTRGRLLSNELFERLL